MITLIVNVLLGAVAVFLIFGLVFAFFFIARGLEKVDGDSHGSTWGFRIIIIPGCIIFWPVLLDKWIKAVKTKQND